MQTYWQKPVDFFKCKTIYNKDLVTRVLRQGNITECTREEHNVGSNLIFTLHDKTMIVIENCAKVNIRGTLKENLWHSINSSEVETGQEVDIKSNDNYSVVKSGKYLVNYKYIHKLFYLKIQNFNCQLTKKNC